MGLYRKHVCMHTSQTHQHRPDDHLADLTRRYSRFSRSAAGLASVIGGSLALVTYFLGALAPPGGWAGRLALAGTPFVWIATKEILRHRYYQAFGRVREVRSTTEERWHLGFTLFTAAVSAVVAVSVLWGFAVAPAEGPSPGQWGYLAIVAVMPWLVWRFMPTPLEFIVGVFLLAQAAMMLAGSHYALWEQPQLPLAAVALMVVGFREHHEFRRLRESLRRDGSS